MIRYASGRTFAQWPFSKTLVAGGVTLSKATSSGQSGHDKESVFEYVECHPRNSFLLLFGTCLVFELVLRELVKIHCF